MGQIKLVIFFLFLSSIGGAIWYVQHLKAENEILTLNNEKLNGAVEQQQALIQQQLRDIESKTAINEQLTKNNAKLTADLNLANEKFNKVNASGDRRIERKREQQRARCFEIAQGSALTEEELNATKKSQINAECTNIANPNYTPY